MKKIIIFKGVFGSKIQKGLFLKGNKKEGFFFIHGLYSSCFQNKYLSISKHINNYGYSVFLFDRSRLELDFKNKKNLNYKLELFIGKTFKDEVKDTELAFLKYLEISKLKRINIIGFSIGGTLSSFLVKKYKRYIKRIFLFGSGISTKNKNRPIVDSYPQKEIILKNFFNFSGNLILVQGTKDNIVPLIEARDIILSDKSNSKFRKLIIIKDADHQFKYLNNKKSEFKLTKMILKLILEEVN